MTLSLEDDTVNLKRGGKVMKRRKGRNRKTQINKAFKEIRRCMIMNDERSLKKLAEQVLLEISLSAVHIELLQKKVGLQDGNDPNQKAQKVKKIQNEIRLSEQRLERLTNLQWSIKEALEVVV